MAINFDIPDIVKEGLKKLASFEDNTVDWLENALSEEEPKLDPATIVKAVSLKYEGENQKDISQAAIAIVSLSSARSYFNISVSDVIKVATSTANLEVEDAEREALRNRLKRLLNIASVEVTAKAHDIQMSYERVFAKAQILTDIRPVFRQDDTEKPGAAMIVNSLCIQYGRSEKRKEFFVAMDYSDLKQLKKQVERAIEKSDGLRLMLEKLETVCLEAEQDERDD